MTVLPVSLQGPHFGFRGQIMVLSHTWTSDSVPGYGLGAKFS